MAQGGKFSTVPYVRTRRGRERKHGQTQARVKNTQKDPAATPANLRTPKLNDGTRKHCLASPFMSGPEGRQSNDEFETSERRSGFWRRRWRPRRWLCPSLGRQTPTSYRADTLGGRDMHVHGQPQSGKHGGSLSWAESLKNRRTRRTRRKRTLPLVDCDAGEH